MVRNPSEAARLEQELELYYVTAQNPVYSKRTRDMAIRYARVIERRLGVPPKELVK